MLDNIFLQNTSKCFKFHFPSPKIVTQPSLFGKLLIYFTIKQHKKHRHNYQRRCLSTTLPTKESKCTKWAPLAQVSIQQSLTETFRSTSLHLLHHIDFATYENAFNKAIKPGKASGPDNIKPNHISLWTTHFRTLQSHQVIDKAIQISNRVEKWESCLSSQKRLQIRLQQLQTNHFT